MCCDIDSVCYSLIQAFPSGDVSFFLSCRAILSGKNVPTVRHCLQEFLQKRTLLIVLSSLVIEQSFD